MICTAGFTCSQTCRTNAGQAGTIACFCAQNDLLACQTCVVLPTPTCAATVVNGQMCTAGTDRPCDTACTNGVNDTCTCTAMGGGRAAWRCVQNAAVCQ